MEAAEAEVDAIVRKVVVAGSVAVCVLISNELRKKKKKKKRRFWMRRWLAKRNDPRHINTFYKLQMELIQMEDIDEFWITLRMPPDVYALLLEKVRPYISKKDTNFRKAISAEERLSLSMRYMALGEGYRTLRQGFRVGLNTVGRVIRETCDGIYRALLDEYLVTPSTEDEWKEVARKFGEKWNFPHVLGAIDGKHVRMACPPGSGSFFYNYKLYYSIVLLAIVNAEYEFMYVDIGSEGCASDGGVWRRTKILEILNKEHNPLGIPPAESFAGVQGDIPYFFVGDAAFPMTEHLIKPYPGLGISAAQRIYNYRLSRARMVVENSFGILSTRFRIYRREIEMRPEGAETVVLATIALHNFLRRHCGNTYMPLRSIDHEDESHEVQRGLWRQEVPLDDLEPHQRKNHPCYVKQLRNRMCNYFLTKEGEVRWQYSKM